MRKPMAWMKELVPQKGLEWQVVLTAHEEMAKDWEQPVIPLYTHPKEWVGLTDEDCDEVERWVEFKEEGSGRIPTSKLIQYIQAKLKERNT